ncbi:MAG: hypothetical protein ABRQ39_22530 [Candidatus Eremiobacterota bacterium]
MMLRTFVYSLIFLTFIAVLTDYGVSKNTYYLKKGGIFYTQSGKAYLKTGMARADLIKLDNIKLLNSLTIDFDGEKVKYIWIDTPDIRTSSGLGVGSSIGKLRKYQKVKSIGGTTEAYSPPYSGLIFCSTTQNGLIDTILVCDPSVSNSLYTSSINSPENQPSTYVKYGTDRSVNMAFDEIIMAVYQKLKLRPSAIQEIILLPSRSEIGEMHALYGGNTGYEATSFCVNEQGGSVIYALYQGRTDLCFKGILAHEYGHAWHYRYTGKSEFDPLISEGFAEWVRYYYEGTSFIPRSEKDYLKGLELFLAVEATQGREGVFKYLKDHSWKPANIPPFKK